MKNYTLNTYTIAGQQQKRGQAGREYITVLDNDIQSIYSYIYNYLPNYQIFNYTDHTGLPYYSLKEQEVLKLISITQDNELNANLALLPGHTGLYNNYSKIPKNQRYYYYQSTKKKIGPEGTMIIRNAPKLNSQAQEQDFLIARLAAAASFYIFKRCIVNEKNEVVGEGEFCPNAEELYSTVLNCTLIPGQPRGISPSIPYSSENIYEVFYPKTFIGSAGEPGYCTNAESFTIHNVGNAIQSYEEIVLDATYSDQEFDKDHKPIYTVTIKDGPIFGKTHVG